MRKHAAPILLVLVAACGQGAQAEPAAPAKAAAKQPDVQASKPAPASAKQAPAGLGKPAPDFTLNDLDGKPQRLSSHRGKMVVLEWFNADCPFARFAHEKGSLKEMAKRRASPELVWLTINSSAPGKQGHGSARNQKARADYAIASAILLDETGAVGHSYQAQKTPHMYVIDKTGVLVYRGAIDNAPMGVVDTERPRLPTSKSGDLVNYVDAALEDVRAGRALRVPETAAYGCSVKYAD